MFERAGRAGLVAAGVCAAVLLALAFWPRTGIRQRIADLATRECRPVSPCVIDLDRVAPAGWDHFFAFRAGAHRADIERIAGIELPDHDTAFATALFVGVGMVIEEEVDLEVERPNVAIFDSSPGLGYLVVDHAQSKVRIESEDDGLRRVFRVAPAAPNRDLP